jgi:hypothetical protein
MRRAYHKPVLSKATVTLQAVTADSSTTGPVY